MEGHVRNTIVHSCGNGAARVVSAARHDDVPRSSGSLAVAPVPLLDHLNGGRGTRGDLLHAAKLTVPQAAKALGIGETKMREIIRNGDVPVVRILGKTLLLERDLDDYLRSGYGVLRESAPASSRSPALPEAVRGSKYLN